jgi:hypothetical protein
MGVNNIRIFTAMPEAATIHSLLILGPTVAIDKKILLSAAMEMRQCFPSTLWSIYITFPTAVNDINALMFWCKVSDIFVRFEPNSEILDSSNSMEQSPS